MFIRWKTQQVKTGNLLVAYLVESRRENKKMRQVNLAYLGSIQEDFIPNGEHRLKFWKSVHERAKRHRLELSPTMRAILLSRVPKGAEDKDCWMTHEEDIARIRQFLEVIELDPASTHKANLTVRAQRIFTPREDGLAQPWVAKTLFLNPPFSDGKFWVPKLLQEYNAGNIGEAVCILLGTAVAANYAKPLKTHPDYAAATPQRLHYTHEYIKKDNPDFISVIVYLGKRKEQFREVFP